MKGYNQILVDSDFYDELKKAKMILSKESGKKLSFAEVIKKLIRDAILMLFLDDDVKSYITEYVSELSKNESVFGVVLFGSVAKGTWNEHSDIDLFIVVDSDPLAFLMRINFINKKLKSLTDKLLDRRIGLYMSPLVVKRDALGEFRSIYVDIIEDGIILYQKEGVIANFIKDTKNRIIYERKKTHGGYELKWNENKRSRRSQTLING